MDKISRLILKIGIHRIWHLNVSFVALVSILKLEYISSWFDVVLRDGDPTDYSATSNMFQFSYDAVDLQIFKWFFKMHTEGWNWPFD